MCRFITVITVLLQVHVAYGQQFGLRSHAGLAIAETNATSLSLSNSSQNPSAFLGSEFLFVGSQVFTSENFSSAFYSIHDISWNHGTNDQGFGLTGHASGFAQSQWLIGRLHYARRIAESAAVGGALRYAQLSADNEENQSALALDVFGYIDIGKTTSLGLHAENLSLQNDNVNNLRILRLGISHKLTPALLLHGILQHSDNGHDPWDYGIGAEYEIIPIVQLLLGIRGESQRFSFGMNIHIKDEIHVAWAFDSQWGRANRLGVSLIWMY